MKKILLVMCALCFVFAGNYESFAQRRTTVKKPVKRKLVKCRVNGKIVYRTKCSTNPNPSIPAAATTGNRQSTQTEEYPVGLMSTEGAGTGGLGNGRGTGQGIGTGYGYGNGAGNTSKTEQRPPVKRQIGPTEGVKITSKPQARYTTAARENQVQGKVVLRVTFSANGAIGAISVISGLGYGLTEEAINAARGIRFEPAKRNGRPYTITKAVEYTFVLY